MACLGDSTPSAPCRIQTHQTDILSHPCLRHSAQVSPVDVSERLPESSVSRLLSRSGDILRGNSGQFLHPEGGNCLPDVTVSGRGGRWTRQEFVADRSVGEISEIGLKIPAAGFKRRILCLSSRATGMRIQRRLHGESLQPSMPRPEDGVTRNQGGAI